MQARNVPPSPPSVRVLLVQTCKAARAVSSPHWGCGVIETYFLETLTSLKASTVLLKVLVLTYIRGSQASILLLFPPLALRFLCPCIFVQKLFLSVEGVQLLFLATPYSRVGGLSVSLCGMGLWQAEDVKRATMGLSSCQPWAACARKSLHRSSVPLRTAALWEGLARKHTLFHWGPLGLERFLRTNGCFLYYRASFVLSPWVSPCLQA